MDIANAFNNINYSTARILMLFLKEMTTMYLALLRLEPVPHTDVRPCETFASRDLTGPCLKRYIDLRMLHICNVSDHFVI